MFRIKSEEGSSTVAGFVAEGVPWDTVWEVRVHCKFILNIICRHLSDRHLQNVTQVFVLHNSLLIEAS